MKVGNKWIRKNSLAYWFILVGGALAICMFLGVNWVEVIL